MKKLSLVITLLAFVFMISAPSSTVVTASTPPVCSDVEEGSHWTKCNSGDAQAVAELFGPHCSVAHQPYFELRAFIVDGPCPVADDYWYEIGCQ